MFFCYLYYAFLMVFVLIFPDFLLPPSANNINNKAHKINKTSNGKKFFCFYFIFMIISCALKMFSVYLFQQFRKCNTHTNTCVITFYALRFPMSLAMHFFIFFWNAFCVSRYQHWLCISFFLLQINIQIKARKTRDMESQPHSGEFERSFFYNIIIIFYMLFYCSLFFCFAFT